MPEERWVFEIQWSGYWVFASTIFWIGVGFILLTILIKIKSSKE